MIIIFYIFFQYSHDQSIHPTWKRYDIKTWTPLLPDSNGSAGTTGTTSTTEPAAPAAPAASKGALQALREVLEEMQHHLEEEKLELGFFVSLESLGRNSWDFFPEISWNKYLYLVALNIWYNGNISEVNRELSIAIFDWRAPPDWKDMSFANRLDVFEKNPWEYGDLEYPLVMTNSSPWYRWP